MSVIDILSLGFQSGDGEKNDRLRVLCLISDTSVIVINFYSFIFIGVLELLVSLMLQASLALQSSLILKASLLSQTSCCGSLPCLCMLPCFCAIVGFHAVAGLFAVAVCLSVFYFHAIAQSQSQV